MMGGAKNLAESQLFIISDPKKNRFSKLPEIVTERVYLNLSTEETSSTIDFLS